MTVTYLRRFIIVQKLAKIDSISKEFPVQLMPTSEYLLMLERDRQTDR